MARDTLGRFEKKNKILSNYVIELGPRGGYPAQIFMDAEGKVFTQWGTQQTTPEELFELALDALTAKAVLHRHQNS